MSVTDGELTINSINNNNLMENLYISILSRSYLQLSTPLVFSGWLHYYKTINKDFLSTLCCQNTFLLPCVILESSIWWAFFKFLIEVCIFGFNTAQAAKPLHVGCYGFERSTCQAICFTVLFYHRSRN